jgi:2,4-dienoyl-CoA reductase-like NADH-dependent reductase (Old Yellow Enzyme family)/thioredoxin reductase
MSVPVVLTPFRIGNVELKNRIIFPSVCAFYSEQDGSIGERMFEYIRARAAGGAAALTIGGSPPGKPGPGRPAISEERFMPRWEETAAMVHGYGARLFCQLHPAKLQAGLGKVMDVEDYDHELIRWLVDSYAAGAKRCMEHGVDAVEIHGGHAHEVAQFLSPYYNHRTDEYGGDWRRRVRFACEIVSRIKEVCGDAFPVIFCISGSEMIEGGREIYESALMAQALVKAGADAIHVSCAMPISDQYCSAPMGVPDCFNVENSRVVKLAVDVPIIAVDKIPTVEQANEVIESGAADLVAMARPLLADPELVNKYAGINPEPPRRCLACNEGCRNERRALDIRCLQNPVLGREATLRFTEAPEALKAKKILIVGAGPAGLEAACDLARRGLQPVLVDENREPGGLMQIAQKPPFRSNVERVTAYRTAFLAQKGIPIRLGERVDEAFLAAEKPDIVFLAAGSRPALPPIAGLDAPNVHTADDVLAGRATVGERVAIVGAGLVGAETAQFLAAQGKRPELFDFVDDVALGYNKAARYFLLRDLDARGVARHMGCRIEEIALPDVVVSRDGKTERFGGFDSVVIAAGRRANDGLADVIRNRFPAVELHVIGDAAHGEGTALDAITEAAFAVAAL